MRRMLTDKLTKSIKEVVNAYNEGEFSAVTANPATTTETLTGIEIDGTGYAVSGGTEVSGTNDGTNWTSLTVGEDTYAIPQGGSVDIDNKTIIENLDGKLETAVGGWKEVTQTTDVNIPRNDNGYEFDLYDHDIAQNIYDNLEINTTYPVTLTISDIQGIVQSDIDHCYILSTRDNGSSRKFGGDDCLHIVLVDTNDIAIEFYVDMDSNDGRIHIYGGNQSIYPSSTDAKLSIDFGEAIDPITVTTYHKIPKEYLEIEDLKLRYESGLEFNDNKELYIELKRDGYNNYDNPVGLQTDSNGLYPMFKYDHGTFNAIRSNNEAVPFTTFIGGGYKDNIIFDKALITAVSGGTLDGWYKTTQADMINFVSNGVINWIKNIESFNITANNTFDIQTGINIICDRSRSSTWSTDVCATVTVGNDANTVTVTTKAAGELTLAFTYEYDTSTITIAATEVYIEHNHAEAVIDDNYDRLAAKTIDDVSYVPREKNYSVAWFNQVNEVDSKFLPGFNVVPTTAGTYTLQVTVDAQGNPTFNWVTVTP